MKLKRLLAGALAAAVAVSTIAVSAFTTSAAADNVEPDKGWYQETGALEGGQLKLIQDWGGSTFPALKGAEELYITFDVTGVTKAFQAYMIYSFGSNADYEGWKPNEKGNPPIDINKDGTYTVAYKGEAIGTDVAQFLGVCFADKAGNEIKDFSGKATFKSVTLEEPEIVEPTSGNEPTEAPGPVAEAFSSITYNYTVTAGDATTLKWENQEISYVDHSAETEITGPGSYSTTISGLSKTGLTNIGFFSDNNKGSVALTLDTIVINEKYTFTVNLALNTTEANSNGLANIWNDAGKAAVVPYTSVDGDCYLAGSDSDKVGIQLMLGKVEVEPTTEAPTEEPTGEPAPTTSYPAFYGFVDGDWSVNTQNDSNGAVKFESYATGYADYITAPDITGDGTYTYTLDMEGLRGLAEYKPGCMVWTIDFKNLAKDLGIKPEDGDERSAAEIAKSKGFIIKDVTINIDPDDSEFGLKDYVIPNDLLIYGDVESQNDDARIEIYNDYGTSKTAYPEEFISYVSEMDPASLITVTFTIEGMDAILKGDTPTPPPAEEADTTAYDKAMEDALATLDKSSDYCYEGVVTLASIAGIAKGAVDVAAEQYAAGEMTLEQYQDVLDTAAAEIQEAIGALIPASDANVTITFTADKAYAKPGDEVTYTVHVDTKVVPLNTLQFRVAIPEEMTYVAGSGAVIEGIKATLGYDDVAVTETADGTIFINGYGATPNEVSSFDLATFKCVVNDGVADGTVLDVTADYLSEASILQPIEFSDSDYNVLDNIAVVDASVTVGEPEEPTEEPSTEEPTDEPATEEPTDTTKAPSDNGNNSATDKPADNNGGNNNGGANNGGSNNGGASDAQPNTGAATAVGLSIFMAAGLAGAVAIKRRRK